MFLIEFIGHEGTLDYAIVSAPTHAAAATYVWNELPGGLQRRNKIDVMARNAIEIKLEHAEVLVIGGAI